MRHSSRICVIGSANFDLTFRAPRFPQAGETLTGRSLNQGLGGKGANQAVAASRLGAEVTFVACVGDDAFGIEAIRQYQADRIDTRYIRCVPNESTGTAAIVVDDQAENSIIVIPGANACLSPADVQRAASAIREADAVVCQLETPLAATFEALRIARGAGKRTFLTPAPVTELSDELLSLCDYCLPNRTEIEALVGINVNDMNDAGKAAKRLQERGVKSVCLTLGNDGSYIVNDDIAMHISPHSVNAVDTTGAGDSYAAALTVFLCEGFSFPEAARRASVVGALTVTRIGAHAAFPHRHEMEQLLDTK